MLEMKNIWRLTASTNGSRIIKNNTYSGIKQLETTIRGSCGHRNSFISATAWKQMCVRCDAAVNLLKTKYSHLFVLHNSTSGWILGSN